MARALVVSEACPMHPSVREPLLSRTMPVPAHELLRGRNTGLIAGHRGGILLGCGPVEIQRGDLDRVFPQLFRDKMYGHCYCIPVKGAVLAADIHHPAVAVHNIHVLFDITASGGDIRAITLITVSAEHGASPDTAARNGKVVYGCNQAVLFKPDLQMHET